MSHFDLASVQLPRGRFIGSRVVEASSAFTLHRSFDGLAPAALPIGDALGRLTVETRPVSHERSDRLRGVTRCMAHAIGAHRTACRAGAAKRQLRRCAGPKSRYAYGDPVLQ
jgi:hypothetical protein